MLLLLLLLMRMAVFDGAPWLGMAGEGCALRKLFVPTTTNTCPQC